MIKLQMDKAFCVPKYVTVKLSLSEIKKKTHTIQNVSKKKKK